MAVDTELAGSASGAVVFSQFFWPAALQQLTGVLLLRYSNKASRFMLAILVPHAISFGHSSSTVGAIDRELCWS